MVVVVIVDGGDGGCVGGWVGGWVCVFVCVCVCVGGGNNDPMIVRRMTPV